MDRRVFWSSKSPLAEYHGITFDHPAFDEPVRLVANQFAEVTLGGEVHTPAPMQINPPARKPDGRPSLKLSFPRIVVGREFKRQLRLVTASTTIAPITVQYRVYFADDLDTPRVQWDMFAADPGGVNFGPDAVQVVATLDNPMRRFVAPIYDPSVFTGLESI